MKFFIVREEWFRGDGATESRLLMTNGMKCCVGFYALAHGMTEEEIRHRPTISACLRFGAKLPEGLKWMVALGSSGLGSGPAATMYMTNDAEDMDDKERERKLTRQFAAQGDEVVFVDTAAEVEAVA